jgi:hypothetical protein
MTANYWEDLPAAEQEELTAIARKYLPLIPGKTDLRTLPDSETAVEVLLWQRLETEILDMHADWLGNVKAAIERTGRAYNRENFLRLTRLWEVE